MTGGRNCDGRRILQRLLLDDFHLGQPLEIILLRRARIAEIAYLEPIAKGLPISY